MALDIVDQSAHDKILTLYGSACYVQSIQNWQIYLFGPIIGETTERVQVTFTWLLPKRIRRAFHSNM